jgi:hypothetical protein
MHDADWRTTFRPDIPSAARVYDCLPGGKEPGDVIPADVAESHYCVRVARKP